MEFTIELVRFSSKANERKIHQGKIWLLFNFSSTYLRLFFFSICGNKVVTKIDGIVKKIRTMLLRRAKRQILRKKELRLNPKSSRKNKTSRTNRRNWKSRTNKRSKKNPQKIKHHRTIDSYWKNLCFKKMPESSNTRMLLKL